MPTFSLFRDPRNADLNRGAQRTPVRVPAELPSAGVFGQALQFAGQPTDLQQQAFDVLGQAGQQAHGFLDQFGAGRRAEIEEGFGTAANNVLADLASRGLAGSSLNLAGQLGVERERQMALGNLADQIAQQRVGLTTDIGRFQAGTLSESAKQQNALLASLLSDLSTEALTGAQQPGGVRVGGVNWPDRTGPAESRFPDRRAGVSAGGGGGGGSGGGGSGGRGGGRVGGGGASNLSPLLSGLANQYAAGAGAAGQAFGQSAGSVGEAIGGALSGAGGGAAADAFGAAAPGVGSGLGGLLGSAIGAPFGGAAAGAAAGGYLGNLLGDLFGGSIGPEGEEEPEEQVPGEEDEGEEEQPEEGGLAPAAQRTSDFQWAINKALGLV